MALLSVHVVALCRRKSKQVVISKGSIEEVSINYLNNFLIPTTHSFNHAFWLTFSKYVKIKLSIVPID